MRTNADGPDRWVDPPSAAESERLMLEKLREMKEGRECWIPGPSVHVLNPVASLLDGLPPGTVVKFEIHLPGKDAE